MKRLHIIGRKNSGKTTLVVDLVAWLTAAGKRVGTIKHTHHQHELDTPGKDSHRHRQAGAAAVGILSPGLNAVYWPTSDEHDSPARYQQMEPLFQACDLVLVEGHSRSTAPRIEVWRADTETEPIAAQDAGIVALVTDDPPPGSLAGSPLIWSRSDLAALAGNIEQLLADR
ncbi:molybdopterin-guanine dinucleotide biosynthesis protein B [Lignipirellula cremea]|uniref:Molybdopterin-guanine dinucleotide biosynthesis adapter protein n=1 Tax=Lignipirellula cremea TaxID=2528010 RepID=A0A518DZP5_9BACT|nr:molybdopterin-guanine dinucleotide biosynthesis protein B [Lignipirellula cremea]QDU97309.1 Molybdopterin-guanine dinucleotide biosynthesis adapter protein [Lignipirellula cremea]